MGKVRIKMKNPKEEIELDDGDFAIFQVLEDLTYAIKTLAGAIRKNG